MQKNRRTLELSVRYSPRINARYLRMVERIAEREHMPESDVLRYCFEAALLEIGGSPKAKAERREQDARALKDAMVTVRTTTWMGEKVKRLFAANRNELEADVLRALLERILPIARDRGMAHVMKLRETALNHRR